MSFEITFSKEGDVIVTQRDSSGINIQYCETLCEAFDLIKSLIINSNPIDKPSVIM